MSADFKIIILPGDLNKTPHGEDLILVITQDEFIRMWQRGEAMLRNRRLKGWPVEPDFRASDKVS